MSQVHCASCSAPLPPADLARGACGACGAPTAEAARTRASGEEIERTFESTRPGGAGGGPALAHRPSLVGQEIGGCRVIELVGTGAMGAVYAATQIQLDRKVALKIIHPELWQNERALKRFQQEARSVGKLSSPHVVQIHQVGFENGVNYLVMEFVAGGNLRTHAARQPGSRITSEEAVKFLRQCCLGLKEAQANGILHRDIKPDNLLLDRNGDVKIADFGLAKTLGDRLDLTASSDLMGTPLYMSPEQCSGAELDFRSDMYSLGASFYYLLTAQPPAEGKTIFEVIQTKTKLQCLSPAAALPELAGVGPLSRVIEKMTALAVEDRYQSYDALLVDLERVARGEVVSGVRHRAAAAASARGARLPWVLAVLLLLAVGAAAAWHYDPLGWRLPPEVAPQVQPQVAPVDPDPPPTDPGPPPDPRPSRLDLWQVEYTKMCEDLRAEGPTDAVRTLSRRLLEELPEESDQILREQVRKLVNDIDLGHQTRQALRGVVAPKTIALPFVEVEQHVAGLRKLLSPEGTPGPELERWLQKWRAEHLEGSDLRDRARRLLAEHWARCRDTDLRTVESELQQRDLGDELRRLEEGKARLCRVFPELHAPLEDEVAAAALAARNDALAARRDELKLLAEIGDVQGRVDGLGSLAQWAAASAGVGASISALRARADELARRYPPAEAGLQAAIGRLVADSNRWGRLATKLGAGLAAFGRRQTEAARERIADQDGAAAEVPELGGLRLALDLMARFLEAVQQGDLREAEVRLARVREEIVKLGGEAKAGLDWLDAWRQRLQALREVTADMVAVPPEKVELEGGTLADVPAFFIDRFEVSRADFRRFLREAEKDGSEAARAFKTPAARAAAIERIADLQEIGGHDAFPMDRLSYHDAEAYLRWRKKALPRLPEWWLAARGPAGKATMFPWGEVWSNKPADRNATGYYVNVDAGGRSRRFPDTPIHHLAGNVAEWLEVDTPAAKTGQLIGGCFQEDDMAAYSGRKPKRNQPLAEASEGHGCRGVVRIAEFMRDLLPL